MGHGLMTVDMVVQKLGVTARTLHYYEEVGLIQEVQRTSGGHRLYDDKTVSRLEQILKLRDVLGYTLQEIKQIMHVEELLEERRKDYFELQDSDDRRGLLQDSIGLLTELVSQIDLKMSRLEQMKKAYEDRMTRIRDAMNDVSKE